MIEPNDTIFIRLISDLAKPSSLPSPWESITDSDAFRTSVLKDLYRLNSSDAHKFLTVLNNEAPPHEAPGALLSRASKAAVELLPLLLRKYRALLEAEARETEHDKFMNHESDYDPFVENTHFTRDSFAGRGAVEPDTPLKLDRWGNVCE
jgi:hypothetical protein